MTKVTVCMYTSCVCCGYIAVHSSHHSPLPLLTDPLCNPLPLFIPVPMSAPLSPLSSLSPFDSHSSYFLLSSPLSLSSPLLCSSPLFRREGRHEGITVRDLLRDKDNSPGVCGAVPLTCHCPRPLLQQEDLFCRCSGCYVVLKYSSGELLLV
jgi:hypothetical protein